MIGAALFGALGWVLWGDYADAWRGGEYIGSTGIFTMPTWPFKLLTAIGCLATTIQFALEAVETARRLPQLMTQRGRWLMPVALGILAFAAAVALVALGDVSRIGLGLLAIVALLVLLVTRLRPDLGLWALLAVVVASSTTWEVIENLPVSIRLFGYDAADPLAYHGDSRLNAFADTACAVAGALFARVASARVVLALAVGTEIALSLWIQDGFLIAAIRALQQAL